jgi:hypothetical protein
VVCLMNTQLAGQALLMSRNEYSVMTLYKLLLLCCTLLLAWIYATSKFTLSQLL